MALNPEADSRGPEQAVADKPKSVLGKILGTFEKYKDTYEIAGTGIFVKGAHKQFYLQLSPTFTIVIAPTNPLLDIDRLNKFASRVHSKLMSEVKDPTQILSGAKTVDKKGGIVFPTINYTEPIGKRVTNITTEAIVDDLEIPQPTTINEAIVRSIRIIVCPNLQVAELAWMNMLGYNNTNSLLPKAFRDQHLPISEGIAEKQLKLLREVTPRSQF